jgi:plasmid maintenance system antidote protein VapI
MRTNSIEERAEKIKRALAWQSIPDEELDEFIEENYRDPFPPGYLIEERRLLAGMDKEELAGLLLMTMNEYQEIISGELPIDSGQALVLHLVLGIPQEAWLKLEDRYRKSLAEKENEGGKEGHSPLME